MKPSPSCQLSAGRDSVRVMRTAGLAALALALAACTATPRPLQPHIVQGDIARLEMGQPLVTVPDFLFETDKAELAPGAERELAALTASLKKYSTQDFVVEGHTDDQGSDEYNLALSKRRAEAVRQHLVRQGLDPSRIDVVARGEDYPVADNDDESGRQKNRRVEILLRPESRG